MKNHPQRLPDAARRDDWMTPLSLFGPVNDEFAFTLDVCATRESARCERFYSPTTDGLIQDWGRHRCWMNPPFDQIGTWIAKASQASRAGALVVALIPARTDTAWWHEHCIGREIRFIKGRVQFAEPGQTKRSGHNAPFPCVLVVFRPLDRVAANERRISTGATAFAHQPLLPALRRQEGAA